MRAISVKKGRQPLQQQTIIPPRASCTKEPQQQKIADLPAQPIVTTEPLPPEKKDRFHFLTWFGVGMSIAIGLIAVWNIIIVPTFQATSDHWHYGDSKVFATDADVGHGGMSRFLAFDLGGQITIIEILGGEIDHARLYRTGSLIGADREHKVITLKVSNVKGYGKPDIVIYIEGMSQPLILYNNGSSFQWSLPQ